MIVDSIHTFHFLPHWLAAKNNASNALNVKKLTDKGSRIIEERLDNHGFTTCIKLTNKVFQEDTPDLSNLKG